jgi:DNA-binding HxlR family transcriptional regulator
MNGFVKRNIYTENAVVVEYELTSYSDTLDPVLTSLSEWGIMHREKIRKERSAAEAV